MVNNLKIAFLGDSITEGIGASCIENCYVRLVSKILNCEVKNYGISGTRIAKQQSITQPHSYDMFFGSRLDFIDSDIDLIFVFGGANDFMHGDALFGQDNDTSSDTSISVVKECEEEYQKYLKSFINFEETGDLVFDEEKQLDSEYVVGEKIILPNLESPNGNEKIFIQQKEGSNISLYKSFEPLQKNDSVTFDKKGDYIVCFVQENQDGTVYNKNFNLTIKTAPKFDLSAFPKTIGINEEIKFEKIYFFNDGETKIANINCINPVGNGITSVTKYIIFPKIGLYLEGNCLFQTKHCVENLMKWQLMQV